jgi:hypothetical protein
VLREHTALRAERDRLQREAANDTEWIKEVASLRQQLAEARAALEKILEQTKYQSNMVPKWAADALAALIPPEGP